MKQTMNVRDTESVSSSLGYRWVMLGVCWLAYSVAYMQRLGVGPLAPFLKEDLGLTAAQVGTLMSASSFGNMITLIPGGWLVDRIGVRRTLFIGGAGRGHFCRRNVCRPNVYIRASIYGSGWIGNRVRDALDHQGGITLVSGEGESDGYGSEADGT